MRKATDWNSLRVWLYYISIRSFAMTQHPLPEQTLEDQIIMRRLALVVGCFLAFTVAMAVGVGVTMG
jgi:hypothetical protein